MKKIKPIKFRGKEIDSKKYHVGYPEFDDDFVFIAPERKGRSRIMYIVEPDSISQFVGYDCNGEEIYSDDLILDEVFPGAVPQKYIAGDRVSVNSIGEKFDYFKLVKEGEK